MSVFKLQRRFWNYSSEWNVVITHRKWKCDSQQQWKTKHTRWYKVLLGMPRNAMSAEPKYIFTSNNPSHFQQRFWFKEKCEKLTEIIQVVGWKQRRPAPRAHSRLKEGVAANQASCLFTVREAISAESFPPTILKPELQNPQHFLQKIKSNNYLKTPFS